ncbi:LssY C-terminal domain-containing protein [Actinomyces capricornis]
MSDARPWSIDDVIDAVFFAIAALGTLWLAWLLLGSGWHLSARFVVGVICFWAVLAYLALPRMHQVLTWLYVPDYFIGRTRTADGLLGDPVNLALRGEEEDIHEAMTAAGWVRADPITLRSSWGIIVSSVMRRSYPAAPVSDLMLFGRKQDFAYQKEVEGNPAQRHHIRFWRTPDNWLLPGGQQVDWLAGATYDRSVGFSALTFQVTHKIDADIDIERDYVVDDVRWASSAAELEIWNDYFTAYHDKNGGGDRIITDGDLYVLDLSEVVPGPQSPRHDAELARARQEEAGARRSRPPELIGAIVLLALMVINDFVTFFLGGAFSQAIGEVRASDGTQTGEAFAAAMVVLAGVIMIVTIILAIATWLGHPRCRIALMVLLTLNMTNMMTQVLAIGVRQASWGLIVSTALNVLALLAMSARACQQWERFRKEERQAARLRASH